VSFALRIAPHVPVWDKSERADGTFSRSDFLFDSVSNTYTCPGRQNSAQYRRPFAMPRTGVTKNNTRLYRASQSDCAEYALKARCCPGQLRRKVPRSVHEAPREVVRGLTSTPEYLQLRRERKKVEMLFAHLQRILKLNRLRLRGPSGREGRVLARRNCTEPAQAGQDGRAAADVRHIREWHELGGTGTDQLVVRAHRLATQNNSRIVTPR
jgi:Transposase DDE domain